MPRSFLVKKIKLDDSSQHHHHHLDEPLTFARSISDSVASLGVRLSHNGRLACVSLALHSPFHPSLSIPLSPSLSTSLSFHPSLSIPLSIPLSPSLSLPLRALLANSRQSTHTHTHTHTQEYSTHRD